MTTEQLINFDAGEGVGIITLNRADRLNAVNWDMAAQIAGLLRDIRFRDDIRAVLLRGEGRSFCAGGDLGWVDEGSLLSGRSIPRFQRKNPFGPFAEVTRGILAVDKPVIAALHGHVVGVGLVYALAADRRFADETTRVSAIFVKRGVVPECGMSYFLPRIAGVSTALRMMTTGAWLNAQEAKEAGIIDDLLPPGEAFPAALKYAKELAKGASTAVEMARRMVYKGLSSNLEEAIDFETLASTVASNTKDAKEGITAFLEKREANFTGE